MTQLVASDLDRTLIYSAAALGLTMPDAEAPRLLCVEVYQGKPLSYVTETAAGLLDELGRGGAVFVPTTTRTREQYGRIHLPGPPPEFAICANGGHLLVNGVSDPDWQVRVARRLADECATLDEVRAHLLRTADPAWLLKERVAEDLFAYLVVERSLLPDAWVKELGEWARGRGWTVSLQGRKLYVVPRPLTKSAAAREVARRVGAEEILAAGDSLLDTDLLLAADRAWRPGHGELADTGFVAPGLTVLEERGIAAGEE
ncbi:HAD family hydrolase, partial [Streptomyces sp. BG9H]